MTVENSTALIVGCTLGGVFLAIALSLVVFVFVYFSPEARSCITKHHKENEKSPEAIRHSIQELPGISWSRVSTLKAERSHAIVAPRLNQVRVLPNLGKEGPLKGREMTNSIDNKSKTLINSDNDETYEGQMVNNVFKFLDEI